MRKWLMVLTVFVFATMAILPVAAQENGTIADIVVASAGGETPEFSILLAAVQAADPAVLAALSDPEQSLTVFAPTDAAFAAAFEAMGVTPADVLADPEALTDILLFHVVAGNILSGDVVALLDAADGQPVRVPSLNGQYIDITRDEDGNIFVDGAPLNLGMVDIQASNGIIHVIDAVIVPESRTIAEIVVESAGAETPEFSTLLAAVGAADPAVLETLSDPEAELTVFAPTDAAFAAAFEAMGVTPADVLADPENLTAILLYHVVPAVVYSGDIVAALTPAEDGAMMEMPAWLASMDETSLTVNTANGATAVISVREDGVYINEAKVVMTDIDAANGVIHVIDAVIVPPSA